MMRYIVFDQLPCLAGNGMRGFGGVPVKETESENSIGDRESEGHSQRIDKEVELLSCLAWRGERLEPPGLHEKGKPQVGMGLLGIAASRVMDGDLAGNGIDKPVLFTRQ